ncbi:MAG: DUF5694 domain-containing protein [Bacteroidota bacterium]
MKVKSTLITVLKSSIWLLFFTSIYNLNDCKAQVKILILGSYHFDNPGLDVNNLQADDVLAEKRQKEIKEVTDLLAKFNPTKIGIERRWQTRSDTVVQNKYQQYLQGKYQLQKPESQQIGFRLAKQLNHEKIYCIDAAGDFDYGAMVGYAQKNGQGDILQNMQKWMNAYMKEEQEFMMSRSIKDILIRHNEKNRLEAGHGMYIKMLEIGKNMDYPGADLVSDWYERNLKIFANITRIAEAEDRILIVIGSGHAPILNELVKYHPDYELEKVSDYLK